MLRPFLVFLAIGGALFVVERAWLGETSAPAADIVIPAGQVEARRASLAARSGRAPTEAELLRSFGSEVDDELLYREALARGFDEGDPVIFRRLVQNLRFAGADEGRDDASLYAEARALGMHLTDVVVRRRLIQRMRLRFEAEALAEEPSDAELRAHYEAFADEYGSEARLRITQLYFRTGRDEAALEALARLREEGPPIGRIRGVGDAFLHSPEQPSQTEAELAERFGHEFAQAVALLESDRWSGPIASAYGIHLVWLHEREPARRLGLEEVRDRVRYAVLARRRADALERGLAVLRAATPVRLAAAE